MVEDSQPSRAAGQGSSTGAVGVADLDCEGVPILLCGLIDAGSAGGECGVVALPDAVVVRLRG
jgi:hypothetical protein